jgi:hypothetical protein
LTSAATRTGNSLASNDWMKSIPLSPASAAFHVDWVSSPSGLTVPIPVITTRRTRVSLVLRYESVPSRGSMPCQMVSSSVSA